MGGWFVDPKIKDKRGYPKTIPCLDTSDEIQEHLDVIKSNLESKERVIAQLRNRIKELEDKHYKDKRLQEMEEHLKEMRAAVTRGFPIEAKESEAIAAWKAKHDAEVHNNPKQYHGCSGGGYTYKFYPTAIGTFSECVCGACHNKAFREAAGDSVKYNELIKEWNGSINFDDV